jgi:hypothetical protein
MVSYLTAINVRNEIKNKVKPKNNQFKCIIVKSLEDEEKQLNELKDDKSDEYIIPIVIREYIWTQGLEPLLNITG